MGIQPKPSRNLSATGGIAIKNGGHAQFSVANQVSLGISSIVAKGNSATVAAGWSESSTTSDSIAVSTTTAENLQIPGCGCFKLQGTWKSRFGCRGGWNQQRKESCHWIGRRYGTRYDTNKHLRNYHAVKNRRRIPLWSRCSVSFKVTKPARLRFVIS